MALFETTVQYHTDAKDLFAGVIEPNHSLAERAVYLGVGACSEIVAGGAGVIDGAKFAFGALRYAITGKGGEN